MARDADRSGRQAPTEAKESVLPPDPRRFRTLQGLILSGLIVLVGGLGYFQLYRTKDYAERQRRQSLRRVLIPAPRGEIYDREHRLLVGNRTGAAAAINLGALRNEARAEEATLPAVGNVAAPSELAARARLLVAQRTLDQVNAITGHHALLDARRLELAFAHERAVPFVLDDELTPEEGQRLTERLAPSASVQVIRTDRPWYPHGSTAAHVLGRVRFDPAAPRKEAASETILALDTPLIAGDSGVEKQYDARLRGHPGEAMVQLDALGFALAPSLPRRLAQPGEELVLSLDLDLQLAAERTMAATPGIPRGAAVAIAVETGEVLALASKPDFDLNAVSLAMASELKQRIDSDGGWLNRAVQGLYPPGSTFKIFTSIAGLRRGTLHPDDRIRCDGFYDLEGQRYGCHNAEGHGEVTLRTALAHSCNIFAYQVGLAAGPEALAEEARRFHFGEPTGVDLPFEASRMLVPDPAWKRRENRGDWTTGDTINLSIGQGFLRYSPLQAACAIASLARRESLTVPTLRHQPGRKPTGDRAPEPLGLTDSDYAALIESLQAVVETGIGREAEVPGVSMAGKTGTAQVLRPEGMMNVAWFVAFAPVTQPKIAVAVAMEGGEPGVEFAGGEYAAPIVREIIGAYFDKRSNRHGRD